MSALPLSTRVRIAPTVYARPFGSEIVLLEFRRGDYFGLDAIGAEIWRRLEGGGTVASIVDAIVAGYDVSREQACRDIVDLIAEMQASELLEMLPAE